MLRGGDAALLTGPAALAAAGFLDWASPGSLDKAARSSAGAEGIFRRLPLGGN